MNTEVRLAHFHRPLDVPSIEQIADDHLGRFVETFDRRRLSRENEYLDILLHETTHYFGADEPGSTCDESPHDLLKRCDGLIDDL
jgi:hypothetical protein